MKTKRHTGADTLPCGFRAGTPSAALLRKFQTLAYEEYAAVLNFPCALQLAHLRENRESAPSAALLRKFQTLAYEEYAAVLNFPC
ncbi:MAG: hypothetical protein AB7E51_10570, partial [Pseudodesulfovibrio sp.]|uniref:hypothetical protein n=1 Tax=Pseudodesulfovibrio sp. TaxID=2035812 RepID=UPI003D0A01AE